MTKISICLDEIDSELLLTALIEKAGSCASGTQAKKNYLRLYGDFKEAIVNGKIFEPCIAQ